MIVASVRALLQRLGPGARTIEPITVRHADVVDPDELGRRLVDFGYRREELVEHRGEFARRGAIIDVFPSTGDAPVRIDLWGDEVDRLTTFGVNDQRSTADIAEALIFPARELLTSDALRQRARSLVALEPWGREQWERLAEGAFFEGMESWLPWLDERAEPDLFTDLLPPTAKIVLVEPRRARDRAIDLLAEEDDLANALASTWSRARDLAFPRLHVEPERLLKTAGSFWSIDSAPESPETPIVEASGWGPVAGDGAGLARRLGQLLSEGYRVVVAADGAGSAARLHEVLLDQGLDLPVVADSADLTRPGGRVVVAPLHHGVTLPASKLAIVAESDLTGRRRAHRRPRPRRRDGVGVFEDLQPGMYVVHFHHGVGRYEGMVKRADRRRRARLPPARLQGQRQAVRAVGPDRHAAPVRRRRGARRCTASVAPTSPRPRAASARRSPRSPRSSSCSTRSG